MFTGIVTHLGQVRKRNDRNGIAEFEIQTQSSFFRRLKLGDSVCVNGVCLTAAKKGKTFFQVQAVPETLSATNLGLLKAKSLVNLEPSCRLGDELGGHFVTGHVDAVGTVNARITKENYTELRIGVAKNLAKYIVPHLTNFSSALWISKRYPLNYQPLLHVRSVELISCTYI